jgi:cysteine dioxygenase
MFFSLYSRTRFTRDDYKEYALFDPSRHYTRNLIATDDETYTLLMLCWNPGKESPIHDHPCDGCWMQVLEGDIRECRYVSGNGGQLTCCSDIQFNSGQLAYITDSMGYHKVGNPDVVNPAITLHLYSPPFSQCRIWSSEECKIPSKCSSGNHYSEYGVLLSSTSK